MRRRLSPKTRYLLSRILPFGLIWLLVAWFILTIEALIPIDPANRPETDISMSPGVFLFASIAVLDAGLFMGLLEVLWVGKLFRSASFFRKILFKTGIYLLFILVVIGYAYPFAAAIESGLSPYSAAVRERFLDFLISTTALSTLIGLSASIFLSLLYDGVSEHLGPRVLRNFFMGTYHRPRKEVRIFMFLDLTGSTALAEELGHERYFGFLRDFYDNLSDAIIAHRGEVYQYVGDEIVVSWEMEQGSAKATCIRCFDAMRTAVKAKEARYLRLYGAAPAFKAAIHAGAVTTGTIGALKKDVFFTGDVLNVTARLQGLCKKYGEQLLVSRNIAEAVGGAGQNSRETDYSFEAVDSVSLRGRAEPIDVFAVRKRTLNPFTPEKATRLA